GDRTSQSGLGAGPQAGSIGTQVTATRLTFQRLGPENAGDLLSYFDGPAFADNPHWRTCYCFFHHFGGGSKAWAARTGPQNRRDKAASIQSGRAHGVLAYAGGDVVGWVHAAP